MNVRLLRRVMKHISEEPKRLQMELLAGQVDPHEENSPKCGTVGCIAGWACILSGVPVRRASKYGWEQAQKLLGITTDQAYALFDFPVGLGTDGWPLKFGKRYVLRKTAKGRARVTVQRIEHFIKTKGAE